MAGSTDSGPRQSSALIRAFARIVPRDEREAWEKEWLAQLWHAYFDLLRDGVEEENADRALYPICAYAFRDAMVTRSKWLLSRLAPSRLFANPRTVLLGISILMLLVMGGTGGFSALRHAAFGLPYPNSANLVLVRRTAMVLGLNASPSLRLADQWTAHQSSSIKVAPFAWAGNGLLLVNHDFFDVLGMQPAIGRPLSRSADDQVVISHDTWKRSFNGRSDIVGQKFGGKTIAGVMPRDFWFLGRPVAALIKLDDATAPRYVNVLGRLSNSGLKAEAEKELAGVGRRKFIVRVEATPLQDRLRRPLIVGLTAAGLMLLISCVWALWQRYRPDGRSRPSAWFTSFFIAKTAGTAVIVSLLWAEIVTRQRIADNGALDMTSLIYILVLLGLHLGIFAWASYDQNKRCRTCCLPVAQPVTFGTWSSTLLDRPAIEFLCPNGHGSLFEQELNTGPVEPPTWTAFDESWRDIDISQPK